MFVGGFSPIESPFVGMAAKHPLGKEAPQAQRLRRLRIALGFDSQLDFAQALKIEKSRWNNFENGYPLSRDVARRLVEKFSGITRDYLEDGRTDAMSNAMLRKLGELPEVQLTPQQRKKAG